MLKGIVAIRKSDPGATRPPAESETGQNQRNSGKKNQERTGAKRDCRHSR